MATFKATAETSSLARSREAEHLERVEAQRLRAQAAEAQWKATEAHLEAESVRAASTSRLRETERVAVAELATKSADLVMRAEHAARQEVAQHAREAREEQRHLREEVVTAESRARALHTSEEQKHEWTTRNRGNRTTIVCTKP